MELTGMRIAPSKAWNGATLLNDAYNANPTATRAAIDLVASLTGFREKWLVFGDMLELGPEEVQLHFELGQYAVEKKATAILSYGHLAKHIVEGARTIGMNEEQLLCFDDKQQLIEWLRSNIASDDLILVKGSRGMKMEEVVEALEKG